MPKEKILFIIVLSLMVTLSGTCFANKTLQTAQRIIVIDPGHGGTENGLVASGGYAEKDIALKLAQKTALLLENRYNVLLTRSRDMTLSPQERMLVANKNKADLFIAIHLHGSDPSIVFSYYFEPPEPIPAPLATQTEWKSHPLLYQPESKRLIHSFETIYSKEKAQFQFISEGLPIIFLEGATMPAVLIEPISIFSLLEAPEKTDDILDAQALIIMKSIDLYFRKK